MSDPTFLDLLRQAEPGVGRGNDELVRAVVPLLEQLATTHDQARVGPMDAIDRVLAVDGALWFHSDDARAPRHADLEGLAERSGSGVDVVGRGSIERDLDARTVERRRDVAEIGAEVVRLAYVPGYSAWELEHGHHDALTDLFLVGLLFASLAVGLDFTEPAELQRFVDHRHRLRELNDTLHPVLARAIVRMTELDRHRRVADIHSLIERLKTYREVDERVDTDLDFESIDGFLTADRSSRRSLIQTVLQTRLFDLSRRNRLLHHRPTAQMLDLTMASVPTQLAVERITSEELFLWEGPAGEALTNGESIRLDRYLRFEDAPWIKGVLDRARSDDRRSRNEVGFSQLRLVLAFLNWHDLEDDVDHRIRSPLLLLPVELSLERGVRNSYRLRASTELAEVNPVLRHQLGELYGLELPEHVDLQKSDVSTFHQALAASIQRSEPAVTLHRLVRPQIRLLRETSRRRTDRHRRRSRVTGRGLRTAHGVEFSYSRTNFRPLGQQLYLHKVKPEVLDLEEHLRSARPVVRPEDEPAEPHVVETTREVYQHVEAASGPYDWAVDLTHCTLGTFNYRKMSLVRDYDQMLADHADDEHPAFDTLFSLEARDTTGPTAAGSAIDLFTVVPADPSQAAAVRWARSGRSAIIQGPPGTGKSQTITNLIADCVARGQRVLFVCQKRAALDVVYHRLAQHGLDRLAVIIHDATGDKKGFIEDLKRQYTHWTTEQPWPDVEPERQAVLDALAEPIRSLNHITAGMQGPVHGGEQSVIRTLGERLGLGDGPVLTADALRLVPEHGAWSACREAVHEAMASLAEAAGSPLLTDTELRHVALDILDAPEPLPTLQRRLAELDALLGNARAAWGQLGGAATQQDLAEALALADDLAPLLPNNLALLDRTSAASADLDRTRQELTTAARDLDRVRKQTANWTTKLVPTDTRSALQQARRFDAMFVVFVWLFPAWWALRRTLAQAYRFDEHDVKPSYTDVLETLSLEHAEEQVLEDAQACARDRFGYTGGFAGFLVEVERMRSPVGRTPLQLRLVDAWSREPHAVERLLAARTSIDTLRTLADRVFDDGSALDLDQLDCRREQAQRCAHQLPAVRAALKQLYDVPASVRTALLTVPLTAVQWDAVVCERALAATFDADPELAQFGREALTRHQVALSHGHHRLLELNAQLIRQRTRERFQRRFREAARPAHELDDAQLEHKQRYTAGRRVLEREFEKVMRHRSIRELASDEPGEVVNDLKPIWLMSPLSISDTLPMSPDRFDVVIFDEASQIPLEEAVPAVYRAPQMIVVGDEMQLPPTAFFTTAQSSDDTAMDAALAEVHYDLDAESFLSHSARCLPSTMLAWHYRSRHEALIRFSNQAFYDGRLLTIPDRQRSIEHDPITVASADEGDHNAALVVDRPVSSHRLLDSPYGSRVNPGEAAYIAHMVRGLLRTAPERTLGIVAFSEAQQGAIEAALETLAAADPVFRRELEEATEREDDGQHVGLFVKNLENVQGDERDIIVLSVCYGPDAKGSMRMNFGPINKGGGEKRLNVVFSRARRHMAVVTSIEPSQITNTYNDGANCLRRYLQYAAAASTGDDLTLDSVTRALARGTDTPVVVQPANPVVDALGEALEEEGLVVARQVGSSQFRVDLAVGRDDEEALAVAVLVDGPEDTAIDVLERHHVRPTVLRAFGWTVVNVLTKDWLTDRAGCLARVLRALDDPASAAPPAPPSPEDGAPPDEPVADATPEPAMLDLAAAVVVLTGSFDSFTRPAVTTRLQQVGARVAKAVTRKTTCVVVGARPGSALHEAQAKNVRLVDEATFLAALVAAETAPVG